MRKISLFLIVMILFVLLFAGVAVAAFGRNTELGAAQSTGLSSQWSGAADIDANAGEWNGQTLPDKTESVPAVGIKIPGYPSITLPKDQQTVGVALLNPEGNPCYFTFELVLKDTEESLYKSKLVPPGQAITQITMSRALAAGEYDATIKITTTSLEDGSAMNGANVETVLVVK
jgi:hypothetical protein